MTSKPALIRRLAAILALLSAVAAVAFLLSFWIHDFPVALITIAAVCGMAAGVWLALTRRGSLRAAGVVLVLCGFFGAIAALIWQDSVLEVVGFVVSALVGVAAARFASETDTRTLQRLTVLGEPAPPPARPALLMNPWSGGGKVKRFDLVDEAKRRGIEPILLDRGLDLRELALGAVERGADALGMAGGDGSQAIVAQVAWEHDLPYVCVPAGTRNHLALDLGLDRDDVTGALDGYTQGIERTIDLATVNGKVFVNNVSLGIYAEIVQSDRYRDAKMKTAADMLPEMIGPDADPFDFEFDGPQGDTHDSAHLILISNNPYRLTTLFGLGSRPRMDSGALGIVALRVSTALDLQSLVLNESLGRISRYSGWREWTATEFEVRSHQPIKAGVDGEALAYDPPVRFASAPAALKVRIPPQAPGVSPAAATPAPSSSLLHDLLRIAGGRSTEVSG